MLNTVPEPWETTTAEDAAVNELDTLDIEDEFAEAFEQSDSEELEA